MIKREWMPKWAIDRERHERQRGEATIQIVQGYVPPFPRDGDKPGRFHVLCAPLDVMLRDLRAENIMDDGNAELRGYQQSGEAVLWDAYGTDFPTLAAAAAALAYAPTLRPAHVEFTFKLDGWTA